MSIDKVKLIELTKISDPRGNLSVVEGEQDIPFEIKRIYYLYDMPADAERGSHGHKELQQFIIPLSGSFKLLLDDGVTKATFDLKRPWQGIYIPPMMWRELKDFSSGAVCLVLASAHYDELDYFHSYDDFLQAVQR